MPPHIKKTRGRPKSTNRDTYKKICAWLVEGLSVNEIAKRLGITRQTIYLWRKGDPVFAELYEEAMLMRADDLTFETIEIADDATRDTIVDPETGKLVVNNTAIQRDKLRVQARTRLLQWLNPQKYAPNQKVDVTTNGKDFYGGICIEPPDSEEKDEE